MLARQPDVADDLVQETLLRAIAARHQFMAGTNLRAWLFVILRNVWNAELRRAARSPVLSAGEYPEPTVSGGQEERQAMRDVAARFTRLPAGQREALWLVVVEGMDYAEAAAVMGVPVGTVRSRLSRARDALRGDAEDVPAPPRGLG
jgi:RNA polymerase sigma-70 factor (ECF subfamily)